MKLDFNRPLVNLEGQIIDDSNMGKILAKCLAESNKGDALKYWELAIKLQKGETIDLDKSDQENIKGFIEKADFLPNITKAQLLMVFIGKKE